MENQKRLVVLVVEDEPLIRMFVVDCLEDAGFKVEKPGTPAKPWGGTA